MKTYGKELIIDLKECDTTKFNRKKLKKYFKKLCKLIDMERSDLHFWDYKDYPNEYKKAPPHLKGTTATQFIMTSDIRVHALDILEVAYINIFSCKDFDERAAAEFTKEFFGGEFNGGYRIIERR